GQYQSISKDRIGPQLIVTEELPETIQFAFEAVVTNSPDCASPYLNIGIIEMPGKVITERRVNGTPHRFERFRTSCGLLIERLYRFTNFIPVSLGSEPHNQSAAFFRIQSGATQRFEHGSDDVRVVRGV